MNAERVEAVLKSCWAAECDEVGPATVREIASGEVQLEAFDADARLDFGQTVATLSVAAAYIRILIEIYKILQARNKEKTGKREGVERVGGGASKRKARGSRCSTGR